MKPSTLVVPENRADPESRLSGYTFVELIDRCANRGELSRDAIQIGPERRRSAAQAELELLPRQPSIDAYSGRPLGIIGTHRAQSWYSS